MRNKLRSNFPTADRIVRCARHHSMSSRRYSSKVTYSKDALSHVKHRPADTVTIGLGTKPLYK